jgi:hypothetical protein
VKPVSAGLRGVNGRNGDGPAGVTEFIIETDKKDLSEIAQKYAKRRNRIDRN